MIICHMTKCCGDWSWSILMFSVSSKMLNNLQRGLFNDAAVGSGTFSDDW